MGTASTSPYERPPMSSKSRTIEPVGDVGDASHQTPVEAMIRSFLCAVGLVERLPSTRVSYPAACRLASFDRRCPRSPSAGSSWVSRFHKRHPEYVACRDDQLDAESHARHISEEISAWSRSFFLRYAMESRIGIHMKAGCLVGWPRALGSSPLKGRRSA
jgi:hypothetical protein